MRAAIVSAGALLGGCLLDDVTHVPTDARPAPIVVADPDPLEIAEGGTDFVMVRLAANPFENVDVLVTTDDATLSVQGGLFFNGLDWDQPQALQVQALQDADSLDQAAALTYECRVAEMPSGFSTSQVLVDDDDP